MTQDSHFATGANVAGSGTAAASKTVTLAPGSAPNPGMGVTLSNKENWKSILPFPPDPGKLAKALTFT